MFMFRFILIITLSSIAFANSTKQGCMMCHQGNDNQTETVKQHVSYLTQEKLEGRLTGSKGEQLATQYVADFLKVNGYVAAGDKHTFFQTFGFLSPSDHKKKQLKML